MERDRGAKALDVVMEHANLAASVNRNKDKGETVWCYCAERNGTTTRITLSEALVYIQAGHRFDFNSNFILVKGTR